jgi:3-dehydroquinate dehydratase
VTSIVVILASPRDLPGLPPDVEVLPAANAAQVAAILSSHDAAVLVSDEFVDADAVAAAVKAAGRPVIEVRAHRWDGETPSLVSAACRGVISGFGDAGIVCAVRLLCAE